MANHRRDALRRVDDDRHDRDAAAQLPEGVAVRRVVAVVAPDPAQARRRPPRRRRAAPGRAAPRAAAVVARLLAGVDHELLPDAEPGRVGGRAGPPARRASPPSRLHTRTRSRVSSGRAAARSSSGSAAAMRPPSPTATIISGTCSLRPKNCARSAHAVHGAVDAEQYGRAGHAVAVQERRRPPRRRAAAGTLVATDVDGQLRRRVRLARQPPRRGRAVSMRARSSVTRPCEGSFVDVRERRLDPRARVDGDRHEREVLGERQQPVGPQVVLGAEALDAAQQQARRAGRGGRRRR